ncbi:uncharacterized protein LOC110701680 isoform X4 [Chenopodium quinoa]|uniref:uncharacterized protein LOC110701680 isoform X4 n=1 Tax=Chenopodium quinoa TaxID=63459 RepID=UPI000B7904E3|nr:uncharacterized protein LOC110701680 isoform X4 [Chenopodium quinoa]
MHDGNNVIEDITEAIDEDSRLRTKSPQEVPAKKKHRGPKKLVKVHGRPREERPYLILNIYGQPVGPTDEVVDEFTQFLGTVARNSELAPLNYVEWPSLPTHNKIWDYVQEKYLVPEEGRKWVMETVNYAWRMHKCRTKKKHFYAFDTDEQRMIERLKTMPKTHFEDLLKYWHLTTTEEESQTNKKNRQKAEDIRTMGPKSYARLRHKLKQEDPNKKEPS